MVFGIDPRSRLKSELTLSEMRLVLVTSRSAIIFLADKATKHTCWRVLHSFTLLFVYNSANIISAVNNKNKGIKGELE